MRHAPAEPTTPPVAPYGTSGRYREFHREMPMELVPAAELPSIGLLGICFNNCVKLRNDTDKRTALRGSL
jgi:hypothetical protein